MTIPEGYEQLSIKGQNIAGLWYSPDEEKLIVEFAKGLARYRYSSFSQSKCDEMLNQSGSLGAWIRVNVSTQPALHPVEKLD